MRFYGSHLRAISQWVPKPFSEWMSTYHRTFFNTLRPRQNGRHFADDTFKRIFLNENVRISIRISLKFVPKGPINNIPALVQIMAWRRSGGKPLSEPMMVSLLTQWVNGIHLSQVLMNLICNMCLEIALLNIITTFPRCQWVKACHSLVTHCWPHHYHISPVSMS